MPVGPRGPARRGGPARLHWIALALVPVFFLVGFGIVYALADRDAADPAPAAATTGPAVTTIVETAPAATTEAAPTVVTETEQATTVATETEEDGPPPGTGAIEIDYGRWEGRFELTDAKLVPSLQTSTVGGRFTYLGGVRCPIRNVVVDGRFYDRDDVPVGLARWESSWVTGASGLQEGKAVPFGAYGSVVHLATSAELEVVRVVCAS